MEHSLTLLCKYGEYTCLIGVRDSTSYAEVVNILCKKWKKLNADSVHITCSLPGHAKCIVDCDVDLTSLVSVAIGSGLHHVDAIVCESSIDSGDDHEDEDNLALGETVEAEYESDLPLTDFDHQSNKLLSDPWVQEITDVGQCFEGGVVDFRTSLAKYAIQVGFDFSFLKNDKERVTAVCKNKKSKGCSWFVHGRVDRVNGYLYIRELHNVHTCGATIRTSKSARMSSNLVKSEIVDMVRENNSTKPVDIVNLFKAKYGLDISYSHAWMAVEKARNEVFGDYALSFDQLRWYIEEVERTNPGSRLVLDYDPISGRFKRLFVAFHASIQGFKHCRPMLFLDSTFLKGRYMGNLLGATAKDGDQGLYPFCFAVVDSEDVDNWIWFLRHIRGVISEERVLTFISNQNTSVLEGVKVVFPTFYHAYCLHHLKSNLRDKLGRMDSVLREGWVNRFGESANAPTKELFQKKYDSLVRECGGRAKQFFDDLPIGNWNNAYFEGNRYGEMCNDVGESFNAWVDEARSLPITKMIDTIRGKMMDLIATRRSSSLDWSSELCPTMDARLVGTLEAGRSWLVKQSTEEVYEVLSNPSYYVDFGSKWCSCYQWQLNGFPCAHAVAAIQHSGKNLNDFVDIYFHVASYHATYSVPIYPIPIAGMPNSTVENALVLPPVAEKQAGRPKKKRIISKGEIAKQIKCGRCGCYGHHNKKTCKEKTE